MSDLKPIETQYKGYRFRSRLEARWAVFFDALGLNWEYEVEGFDLGETGWYLPDFKILTPDNDIIWYEIKQKEITEDLKFSFFQEKVEAGFQEYVYADADLIMNTNKEYFNRAVLLSGDPLFWFENAYYGTGGICPRCGQLYNEHLYEHKSDLTSLNCYWCDFHTPSGGGHPFEPGYFLSYRPHKGMLLVANDGWIHFLSAIKDCAIKARQARFEYGETPA